MMGQESEIICAMATIKCSFCGKSVSEVERIISGPNREEPVWICNECVGVCASILHNDRNYRAGDSIVMIPKRDWLARFLAPKWWDS
jgi:ATP-dependent Clp protease ATP-binding subunit ClpX